MIKVKDYQEVSPLSIASLSVFCTAQEDLLLIILLKSVSQQLSKVLILGPSEMQALPMLITIVHADEQDSHSLAQSDEEQRKSK